MQSILSFLVILIAWSSFAKELDLKELQIFNPVTVNSDVEDSTLPKGKCLIHGKVFYEVEMNPYSTDFIKASESVQFLYAIDGQKIGETNPSGEFEILVDVTTNYLLFTKKIDKDSVYEKIYFENYAFNSQHTLDLSVFIPLRFSNRNIMVDKPVIYAYSETPIDFTLKLIPKGNLTFTYPSLPADQTWKMKTDLQGNLTAENGKNYPYLFWESTQETVLVLDKNPNSNEIILQHALLPYLEKNLSSLGLNAQESTDFITYWAPKLQPFKMIQVQFFVDENCSIIGELEINPRPKQLRRVYAIFNEITAIPNQFNPKPLEINQLKRDGFTVIEWGGSLVHENVVRNAD